MKKATGHPAAGGRGGVVPTGRPVRERDSRLCYSDLWLWSVFLRGASVRVAECRSLLGRCTE